MRIAHGRNRRVTTAGLVGEPLCVTVGAPFVSSHRVRRGKMDARATTRRYRSCGRHDAIRSKRTAETGERRYGSSDATSSVWMATKARAEMALRRRTERRDRMV
ncbi:protein of unknown function [Burkholderia multivorans]